MKEGGNGACASHSPRLVKKGYTIIIGSSYLLLLQQAVLLTRASTVQVLIPVLVLVSTS
jgi:hypothetical protein